MIFGHQTVVDYKKLANSVVYTDMGEKPILQAGEAGWIIIFSLYVIADFKI